MYAFPFAIAILFAQIVGFESWIVLISCQVPVVARADVPFAVRLKVSVGALGSLLLIKNVADLFPVDVGANRTTNPTD